MSTLEKLAKECEQTPGWIKSHGKIIDKYKGYLTEKEKQIESLNQRGYEFQKPKNK